MNDEHRLAMNKIYKYQKYIYNLTRKYYLFGRDPTIQEICTDKEIKQIIEVGCGNGRNLFKISDELPTAFLLGIDICDEMLAIGNQKLQQKQKKIKLLQLDASHLSDKIGAHLIYPPDRILAFYSLSMMPNWQQTLEQCLAILPLNAKLHIIDFTNFIHTPRLFGRFLNHFMDYFRLISRAQVLEYIVKHKKTKRLSYGLAGLYYHAELSH